MSDWATTISSDPPSAAELAELLRESGGEQDEERLSRAIEGTSRWWTVRDDASGRLVAVGRCLTDWVRYACIYDVVVSPRRQRQGVGTALMKTIVKDLIDADVRTVHLWPTKGKVPFYEGLAFEALPGDQPVMVLDRDLFLSLK